MLLNSLKEIMNVNRQNNSTYEPFHISISRSAFVAGIGIPTCMQVTLGGDVYVKDTGRRVMQMDICLQYLLHYRSSSV